MSEMVDRVARAICEWTIPCRIGGQSPDDTDTLMHTPLWYAYRDQAAAAIAAMREPTGEMPESRSIALETIASLSDDAPIEMARLIAREDLAAMVWERAIDEALK